MVEIKNPIERYFNSITPYHYYLFFFLFLGKYLLFWHMLNLIFLLPPMEFDCGGTKGKCPCEEPTWDTSVFTKTIQTKFNLLCERAWLISFSQSMLSIGTLIGAMLFGFMSDRYGRLPSFSISCSTIAVAGCLVSIMPSVGTFIFMRCIEGVGVGGAVVTSYVLCVEYCGVRHREVVTSLLHIPVNLSHMSLAGVSYLIRDCDHLQLAISIPMLIFIALKWLILESPKWYMDNGDTEKAITVMEKIGRFNKRTSGNFREEIDKYHATHGKSTGTKMSFWQVFHHKRLTINFVCMSVIYFVCGMGYYGVSQYIGKMSGNIHANVAISGFLLLPGTLAAVYLLQKLTRRVFLMSTNFLSGILMITVICIPAQYSVARVAVACICNCFFFMSFIIVFLYGVELFPTAIRNSVLGVLSVTSRLGQITAPPVNYLPETISGAIFGGMAIIGGLLCYPLPETKDTELPTSLEDTKTLPRRFSKEPPQSSSK